MSCGPQMPAMPLSMVKAGETVRVSRVKGNEDMKHHLKDLGFVEGNEIHVVSSSGKAVSSSPCWAHALVSIPRLPCTS